MPRSKRNFGGRTQHGRRGGTHGRGGVVNPGGGGGRHALGCDAMGHMWEYNCKGDWDSRCDWSTMDDPNPWMVPGSYPCSHELSDGGCWFYGCGPGSECKCGNRPILGEGSQIESYRWECECVHKPVQ